MIFDIFKNIQYNVYYKAIFVLFGALLILSLFLDIKAISNTKLFYISISSVIYSAIMWILNDLVRLWEGQINELRAQMEINYMGNLKKVLALHIMGAMIWLSVIYSILFVT